MSSILRSVPVPAVATTTHEREGLDVGAQRPRGPINDTGERAQKKARPNPSDTVAALGLQPPEASSVQLDVGGRRCAVRFDVLARQDGMLGMLCRNETAKRQLLAGEVLSLEGDEPTFKTAYGFMCSGSLPPPPQLSAVDLDRLRSLAKAWTHAPLYQEAKHIYPLRQTLHAAGNRGDAAYALADKLAASGRFEEADKVWKCEQAHQQRTPALNAYHPRAQADSTDAWLLSRSAHLLWLEKGACSKFAR